MSLSPDQILALQGRAPRYTSYPTAPMWRSGLSDAAWSEAIRTVRQPASVYVHLPFCAEQCSFCACNQVVAGRREAGRRYLRALERHVSRLPLARPQIEVQRIHLGGGTPTWYTAEELAMLMGILARRFRLVEGGELDVEVDPEITTDDQIDALAALGVTRLSMGVQSFDAGVLDAVGRPQRAERIGAILERGRKHGMKGLNIDLMYGLPRQDEEVFARDLARTIELGPDRLAVFGYAHVPWLKPHQKRLDAYPMPGDEQRLRLFLMAQEQLQAAGYQAIGFDHFAKPDDELAVAAREGNLHRNFMGYTTLPDVDLIGIGMSAISETQDTFFQEHSNLAKWWKAVEDGQSTREKGMVLSREDRLRKDLIGQLMCNLRIDWTSFGRKWQLDPAEHFADELHELDGMEDMGLIRRTSSALEVTIDGRLLVRKVASTFDAYLRVHRQPRQSTEVLPRFSQLV